MPPVPERDPILPAFAEGIRLFNEGLWFEAHEAWEGAWLRTEGRERMFYHGLIQAAAACVHLQRNQRKGAQLLYQKSRDKLQHYSGTYKGLAIGAFNEAFAAAFVPVLAEEATVPIEGAAVLATIPKIDWQGTVAVETGPKAAPSFLKDEGRGG